MLIKISEIIVENRARKYYDSLDPLERSIENLGLLQPIGITTDMKLIFGGRRLRACKNLGWTSIPARIFDIDANDPITALRMERSENTIRLDLTASEKVELAMRIEQVLEGRQGQRTDLLSKAKAYDSESELVVHGLQVEPGNKSCEIAAKAVGMSEPTYRRAKAVVNSGNADEIQAMDSGEKSIRAAHRSIKENTKSKQSNNNAKATTSEPKEQMIDNTNKTPDPQVFKITLRNNPDSDAEVLLKKGGHDYCTKLATAILKAAGHQVVI